MVQMLLLVVAVVLFLLAAGGVSHPRFSLMSAGLAAFAGSFLVH
jgi:hypothetical protein